jgi:hypothetical protein
VLSLQEIARPSSPCLFLCLSLGQLWKSTRSHKSPHRKFWERGCSKKKKQKQVTYLFIFSKNEVTYLYIWLCLCPPSLLIDPSATTKF